MAATFVTSKTGSTSGFAASPCTVSSVACGTAANTLVIGWILTSSSVANTIGTMSVGGDTSATVSGKAQEDWSTDDHIRVWYWTGTGPGTVDITFPWTGSVSSSHAGVLVYSGASGIANVISDLIGAGTTTPSYTVSSATGDLAVAVFVHLETTRTATANGTLRLDEVAGIFRSAVFEEAGAASVAVDGTFSGTAYPYKYGFSVTTSGGGGGSSSLPLKMHTYRQRRA